MNTNNTRNTLNNMKMMNMNTNNINMNMNNMRIMSMNNNNTPSKTQSTPKHCKPPDLSSNIPKPSMLIALFCVVPIIFMGFMIFCSVKNIHIVFTH